MDALQTTLLGIPGPLAYAVIALLVFGEAALLVGFVLPGETAVFLGGVLASVGVLSLPALLAVVVVAAVTGDAVGYLVGRRFGPRLLRLRILRRHADRLAGAQERLREKGGWAVFLGRFTAFLRAVMPGIAGASRMPWFRFARFNVLGALIWGGGVTVLGDAVGGSYAQALPWLGRSSLVVLGVVVLVVLWLWHRRRGVNGAGAPSRPESAPDPRAARSEPCPREPVRSP